MRSDRSVEQTRPRQGQSDDEALIAHAREAIAEGDLDRSLEYLDEIATRFLMNRGFLDELPMPMIVLDEVGRVEFMNGAAEALLGPHAENLLRRRLLPLVHADEDDRSAHPASVCALSQVLGGEARAHSTGDVFERAGEAPLVANLSAVAVERDGRRSAVVSLDDAGEGSLPSTTGRLLQASLDALPLHIAILDEHGRVASVNVAWRRFGDENDLASPNYGIGIDYIGLCETAEGEGAEDARMVGQGLRDVLSGTKERFSYEYPCHSPNEERWFVVHARAVKDESGRRLIVVSHENITTNHLAEARLRRLNEALEEGVRQRTRALATANRNLKAALDELDTFSYSVSHDLRAPLRGIEFMAQVLAEEHAPDLGEEGKELVRRILEEEGRMSLLVDDLLDLSRVARTDLHRVDIDLADVARGVVSELRRREPGRRVDVAIPKSLRANGDPVLMRAVMDNLIGNAWKYTSRKANARIAIGATESGDERVFYVRDNGVGFEAVQAPMLFKPFTRLHPPSEFPGTGVGLATVDRIIRRHGGRVWAEGRPGEGATFRFTLPGGASAEPKS